MNNNENAARRQIVEIGRRMYDKGYVAASEGNISVRLDKNHVLTTPTGCSKGFLEASELTVVRLNGEIISGRKPSTELPLHLFIYQNRCDVNSVVHAHPPYATGFATAGIALDRCALAEIIVTLGSIPLARYGAPSTDELPRSLEPHIAKSDAFLLANHGVVTVGVDLKDAYFTMERVEHAAHIIFVARALGGEKSLPQKDVEKLYDLRKSYGIDEKHQTPCNQEASCNCKQTLTETEFEATVQAVIEAVRKRLYT